MGCSYNVEKLVYTVCDKAFKFYYGSWLKFLELFPSLKELFWMQFIFSQHGFTMTQTWEEWLQCHSEGPGQAGEFGREDPPEVQQKLVQGPAPERNNPTH